MRRWMNRIIGKEEIEFRLLKSASVTEMSRSRISRLPPSIPRHHSNYDQFPSYSTNEFIAGEMVGTSQRVVFTFLDRKDELSLNDDRWPEVVCDMYRAMPSFNAGIFLKSVSHYSDNTLLLMSGLKFNDTSPAEEEGLMRFLKSDRFSTDDGSLSHCLYRPVNYLEKKEDEAEPSSISDSAASGFVIIGYKLLSQETPSTILEQSWLAWSGARELYKTTPKSWNLKMITLYRACEAACDFPYILVAEFGALMSNGKIMHAVELVDRLKARNCGHVTLYCLVKRYGRHSSGESTSSKSTVSTSISHGSASIFEPKTPFRQPVSPDRLPNLPKPSVPSKVDGYGSLVVGRGESRTPSVALE